MGKRLLSLMLTLFMVLLLVPATAFAESNAETGAGCVPNVTTYATKEQLMDDTFAPNANGTANNIGKLVFGSNGTTPQQWYILGRDDGVSGDNTIIFSTATIGKVSNFSPDSSEKTYDYVAGTGYGDGNGSISVYATHYGASLLRNDLNNMVSDSNTTYFSAAEKGLLNATTVTTYDNKNDLDYTTTDKLYALATDESGSSSTIQAGSRRQVTLAQNSYWNTGNTFFLRTALSDFSVMCTVPGFGLNNYGIGSYLAVRPASNLNLSSVLFASAATGGAGSNITLSMPMKLRFDGSGKAIGTVTYDPMLTYDASHKIVAHKDPSATGNVFLVVQGNDGTQDWFYSVAVEETTELTARQIANNIGSTNLSLANCKIWLETKDEADGLIYAVNAEASTYSVTLNANGGTVNGNVDSYTSGKGTALPTDVTMTGCTFRGWYNNPALMGKPVTSISATDTGDKEYWAKWEANTYKVILNANGGTINDEVTSYTYGMGAALPTGDGVTSIGHTFAGWYDNEKLTGNAITEIGETELGEKQYWAKWEHQIILVEEKAATCTADGYKAHYACKGCDTWFEDAAGTVELTDRDSYTKNALGHRNETFTTRATASADGNVVRKCSVCNETLATTVIPKVSNIKLSVTSYTYDGKTKTPTVKVIDAKGNTISSGEYTVSYQGGRKNVGQYRVTVTFKSSSAKYTGSKYLYFNINPKGTNITSVGGASKAFTVKWKKQSAKMATSTITGYQVRYSTSSKMTGAKTTTVKGYKYTGKKITKLKAKKKYYVQVRTYKTVSGKNYYSSWSKVNAVKTK